MHPKTIKLFTPALAAGALGFILRLALYRFGFDEKNILSTTHPLQLACLGLTVFLAVYLGLTVRALGGNNDPAANFPESPLRTLVILAAACFTAYHALTLTREAPSPMHLLRAGLAFAGAGSMVLCVLIPQHARGLRTLCRGVVCAFFSADMLCRYQSWSGNPQLPDYLFQVLACALLALLSYQRLAFDTGLGSRRKLLWLCLIGLCLCLLCAAGPETRGYYLGGACWAAGCLCTTAPPAEANAEENPAMFLPEYVKTCIDALENVGYQAWAVGGCVRDALLGLTPNDYDLCTDADPSQTEAVFSDYPLILNGKKHGTVGVILDHNVVEITSFRTEGDYKDNRHPEWVEFVSDVKQDLARRDFTVNAMAYSPKRGFADPFGGREDLKNKILRAVGSPTVRFTEDALRVLRGVRFAVRYGLTPEAETEKAMAAQAYRVTTLAQERVFSELCKLLPLVTAEDLLRFAPVLIEVLPELKPQYRYDQNNHHHIHDLYTHTAHVTGAMPPKLHLRWTALLHDTGKPATRTTDDRGEAHYHGHAAESVHHARSCLTRLKAPTALREQVELLIDKHMVWFPLTKSVIRRWISRLGFDTFDDLITLQKADCIATGTADEASLAHFGEIRRLADEIREENACLSIRDLAVNGYDLLELGFRGREIGETLNKLLNLVLEEEVPNEKAALLAALQVEQA